MSPGVIGLGWALVCAGWLARARPAGAQRTFDLAPRPPRLRLSPAAGLPRPRPRALVALVGAVVVAGVIFPPAALAILAVVAIRPLTRARKQARARAAAVERDLADVVALVGLAVGSGENLPGALTAAAAYGDGPLAEALGAAMQAVRRGGRIADTLELLPHDLGEAVRPFVAALVSCDRYGAPLAATLDRLAVDVRTASRQRAEAAARRLPVRLLFPLVSCILPAFALLTVAPLIAGSVRGLGL